MAVPKLFLDFLISNLLPDDLNDIGDELMYDLDPSVTQPMRECTEENLEDSVKRLACELFNLDEASLDKVLGVIKKDYNFVAERIEREYRIYHHKLAQRHTRQEECKLRENHR